MANDLKIEVNGVEHAVRASPDTPLLYVLRNELNLSGPRSGCDRAQQCGACSVLLDRNEVRSCMTEVGAVRGKKVTTVEGYRRCGRSSEGVAGRLRSCTRCSRRGSTRRFRSAATARAACWSRLPNC